MLRFNFDHYHLLSSWNDSKCPNKLETLSNHESQDSEVDLEDGDHTEIDIDLMRKVVDTVESYFSDENLLKDSFLRKHVTRHRLGFVSLKLIASLRRVKTLTKDWRVVAFFIKNGSQRLEINESYTKLRRIQPLPNFMNHQATKVHRIVAYNFSNKMVSSQEVRSIFERCGEVISVKLINAAEAESKLSNIITDLNDFDGNFALIKLRCLQNIKKVIEQLSGNQNGNWRNNLKIIKISKDHFCRSEDKCCKLCSKGNKHCDHDLVSKESQNEMARFKLTWRSFKSRKYPPTNIDHSTSQSFNTTINYKSSKSEQLAVKLIRTPKGPDGTTGFNQDSVKIRTNSTSEFKP